MKRAKKPPPEDNPSSDREVASEPSAVPVDASQLPSLLHGEQLRKIAAAPGLQAFWGALLPLVGVLPSRPGEYPGVFKVEPGPGTDEATVYVDIPSEPYEYGKPSAMERVLALNVKLEHDYRFLGDRYYCVDCEAPSDEASH